MTEKQNHTYLLTDPSALSVSHQINSDGISLAGSEKIPLKSLFLLYRGKIPLLFTFFSPDGSSGRENSTIPLSAKRGL